MNDESKEKKELIEELKKLRERLTEMESLETERNNTETALLLTQFTLDNAPDAVYWMDPDVRFLYANEIACCTLGYSREELLSMGVEDIDPNLPDRYCIEVHSADEMPELLAYTTEGFINAMAELGAGENTPSRPSWKLEREGSLLRFRMSRPV